MGFFGAHGHFLGLLLLLGLAFLPRLTMLLAMATPFGCLAWIAWVFVPHFLVAIYATAFYWHTNPILCIIAWIWALVGTGGEGTFIHSKTKKK